MRLVRCLLNIEDFFLRSGNISCNFNNYALEPCVLSYYRYYWGERHGLFMRKALLFLAPIVFLTFASSTLADSVNFTVASTVAGQSFTLTFSEPSTLGSLSTFTTVDYSTLGSTTACTGAEVDFYSLADGGLFDIYLNGGVDTVFEFAGEQSYSGTSAPFTLLTGIFPISFGDIVENGTLADISGGTVTATAVTTATPEPATLALLGSGLFAIGVLRRKKRLA